MRRPIEILSVLLALSAGMAAEDLVPPGLTVSAEVSDSHAPSGSDMDTVHRYSDKVGRDLLKEELGLDLNAMRFEFNPSTLRFEQVGEKLRRPPDETVHQTGSGPSVRRSSVLNSGPALPNSTSNISLALDQNGDLLRLRNDVRDIPFAMRVEGQVPVLTRLTHLQTRLWVPFSAYDEFRAEANLPVYHLKLGQAERLLQSLGVQNNFDLRSDYTNRLGVNQVQAGMGTQWVSPITGSMDLNYDYSQRFGQGLDETIHWLKLRKDF